MAEERDEYLSRTTGRVRKRRRDGWTRREIETFLAHLRVTANITASAAAAGKHVRGVYALRDTDPAFAADMDRAFEEGVMRLRSKSIVYAETQGRIPPPRDDGEPAEAPMEDFDPNFALKVLAHHSDRAQGRRPRGGPKPKSASLEELLEAGVKLLGMMKRRRAVRPGA
jgi:hypothetical protein